MSRNPFAIFLRNLRENMYFLLALSFYIYGKLYAPNVMLNCFAVLIVPSVTS